MDKPLTLNQLAVRTGLPREWLRDAAEAGRLPCLRVGDLLLFNVAAVEKTLAELAASRLEVPSCR